MLTSYFRLLGRIVGVTALVVGGILLAGALLPAGQTAVAETVVGAPPEAVWDAIADVSNAANLRTDLRRVDILPEAGGQPVWREVDSRGEEAVYTVVENVRPRRRVVRVVSASQPFSGSWTFALEPAGKGTRVRISEQSEIGHPLYRLVARVFLNGSATVDGYRQAIERRFGAARIG